MLHCIHVLTSTLMPEGYIVISLVLLDILSYLVDWVLMLFVLVFSGLGFAASFFNNLKKGEAL